MKDSSIGEGPRVTLNRENLDAACAAYFLDDDKATGRQTSSVPATQQVVEVF